MTDDAAHYLRPDWMTRHLFNPLVAGFTRLGLSIRGSRVLETRGRRSGEPRRVPVNPLSRDGVTYLVAPRGTTEWVRNVRADGGQVVLIQGRKRSSYRAVELDDGAKPAILRDYLVRWHSEVGRFFDGVGPEASDEELSAIAGRHPVFRLEAR